MNGESNNRTARWITAIFVLVVIGLLLFASMRDGEAPLQSIDIARETNAAICADRLAALGRALRMYAADYDGALPVLDTPWHADTILPDRLNSPAITPGTLCCPARPEDPYVYHCYRKLGEGKWPKWMDTERTVTTADEPGTWIAADVLLRGSNGPHLPETKAFNFLRVDGSVRYSAAQPRTVYQ